MDSVVSPSFTHTRAPTHFTLTHAPVPRASRPHTAYKMTAAAAASTTAAESQPPQLPNAPASGSGAVASEDTAPTTSTATAIPADALCVRLLLTSGHAHDFVVKATTGDGGDGLRALTAGRLLRDHVWPGWPAGTRWRSRISVWILMIDMLIFL